MEMYALYRQTHRPCGIENSVYCNFVSPIEKTLVVTAASQLTIYKVKDKFKDLSNEDLIENFKLYEKSSFEGVLVELDTWSLYGCVVSMKSIRNENSLLDVLLLSFSNGRFAIIEFDIETFDLKTSLIHSFEENISKLGIIQNNVVPSLVVDPLSRCAAMLLTKFSVAIIAFQSKDEIIPDNFQQNASRKKVPRYDINLKDVDPKLQKIISIEFLHDYYEPTLLVLYESPMTWSGRVACRQDTCSITALSLNTTDQTHPIIWSLSGLPYDCIRVKAIPKPIGGVLVFAANSVVYLNQSLPSYGVSLNSGTEGSTSFPLKTQDDVCFHLNGSYEAFITPTSLLLCLSNGDLYVMTLGADSMRNLRSFHFQKLGSVVQPSCINVLDNQFVFIGSRVGYPELLKLFPEQSEVIKNIPNQQTYTDNIQKNEDFDVYGKCEEQTNQIILYNFLTCDSLMNIGPCSASELGEPNLSSAFSGQRVNALELVILSGQDKSGSLSILHKTLKPHVRATFGLPGCDDMWTVYSKKVEDSFHSYLLLSREDSTLVLETKTEITELENSGFTTDELTVFVGNLNDGSILQICASSVSLLNGRNLIKKVNLDLDSPIQQCSLSDPHVILLTADGRLLLLNIEEKNQIQIINPSIAQSPPITSLCLYLDRSNTFKVYDEKPTTSSTSNFSQTFTERFDSKKNSSYVDEEDELLYGSSNHVESHKPMEYSSSSTNMNGQNCGASYWLVLIRKHTDLEIYDLSNQKLSFVVPNFSFGKQVLIDFSSSYLQGSEKVEKFEDNDLESSILEISLVALDPDSAFPYLLARQRNQILIYKAYRYENNVIAKRGLKLRFKKVDHGILIRKPSSISNSIDPSSFRSCFRSFTNISGYSGIFITGLYPYWIFFTSRGNIKCHPMKIDGWVTCFSMLHNINCPNGFIYFNKQGELRICTLAADVRYDTEWPLRRIQLSCTPCYITYSIENKVYSVVTSTSEACKRMPFLNQENEVDFEDLEKSQRFIYPQIDRFQLKLLSPITWECVPNTTIEMLEFEHVTCMKSVWLTPSSHNTIRRNYVVIGTSNIMGEEMSSRGRLLITEVIEVVPERGKPHTKNRYKKIYAEEQRGAVSALCGVEGNLLAAIGQKVFIWKFDSDGSLRGLAFVDSNMYTHQALSFRNFALIGDIQRSITLLRYQDEFKTLSVLSRDVKPLEVYSIELLIKGDTVAFLVSDSDKNLSYFMFQPEAMDSHGGSRLVKCGDIHVGQHVNCMWRIGTVQVDKATGLTNYSYSQANVSMMGTLDGAIGQMIPVTEKVYRRLSMLQNYLCHSSVHVAGLNPKAFRAAKHHAKVLSNPVKVALDGDLLWSYHNLSKVAKHELARKIGSTNEQLSDDLMEIHRSSCVM